MKKLLCIHGWEGTPDSAWKPWFKGAAESLGYETHFPQMPNTMHPKKDEWVKAIQEIVTPEDEWTLVGHSLGCPAILRFLEKAPENQHISKVITLAGVCLFDKDEFEEIRPFLEPEFDWVKIKKSSNKFVVIHSKDDSVVRVDQARFLAKQLGVEPIILDGFKHFGSHDGVTQAPILLEQL